MSTTLTSSRFSGQRSADGRPERASLDNTADLPSVETKYHDARLRCGWMDSLMLLDMHGAHRSDTDESVITERMGGDVDVKDLALQTCRCGE